MLDEPNHQPFTHWNRQKLAPSSLEKKKKHNDMNKTMMSFMASAHRYKFPLFMSSLACKCQFLIFRILLQIYIWYVKQNYKFAETLELSPSSVMSLEIITCIHSSYSVYSCWGRFRSHAANIQIYRFIYHCELYNYTSVMND